MVVIMSEMFYVIENRTVGIPGRRHFVSTILYSSEDIKDCAKFEDAQRKKYKDRTMVDCFVKSQSEIEKEKELRKRWNALTEEQKKETIEIDGKKYVKAIYEQEHNGGNEK
jgi:hypothetical protein